MNGTGFENFYLNSTRVGSNQDTRYFFNAFYSVVGYRFGMAEPGKIRQRMSPLCTKIKTQMLSSGCQAKDTTRVITAFKKWFRDSFD